MATTTGAVLSPDRSAGPPQSPAQSPAAATVRPPLGLGLFVAGAAVLAPWTVLLALTLPAKHEVHQWRIAWTGFDALLVCDAWFDVSLDAGTPDIWLSGALALFIELPLAAFLIHRVYGVISALSTHVPPS